MSERRKQIPLEVIQQWLKDPDCDVRQAAMNACQGRDVPLEVIQQGLKDPDWRVRRAATNACIKNGMPIPVIRTIEPPPLDLFLSEHELDPYLTETPMHGELDGVRFAGTPDCVGKFDGTVSILASEIYEDLKRANQFKERLIFVLLGVIGILIIALAATNAYHVYQWSQFDTVIIDSNENGNAIYSGGDNSGGIYNGTDSGAQAQENQQD